MSRSFLSRLPSSLMTTALLVGLGITSQVVVAQVDGTTAQAQKMYVAYYGRPGDPAGIDYWSSRLAEANGTWISDLTDAFGRSEEYTERYGGLADATLIDNLFLQLYNRTADPAGLSFYLDLLNGDNLSGANPQLRQSSLAQIALDIANGSVNEDLARLENKLEVAEYFTNAVRSSGVRYDSSAIGTAASLLAGVDASAESVAQARAEVDALAGESQLAFPIVDTGQVSCYADGPEIPCPSEQDAFYGQDAQHQGRTVSYLDNGDGTVTDLVTGLIWQQSPDTNGDGVIDIADELTHSQAQAYCEQLTLAGHSDWRLPDIKTLYSLIDFSGVDPSGYEGLDTSGLRPFIDTRFFEFAYGDTNAGERIIDSQYASDTLYVSTTANGDSTLFGVNFADGRIKGYGLTTPFGLEKTFSVLCVRGNEAFGRNDFVDNGDGTISDRATGLMWAQTDSGQAVPEGLNWQQALAWVQMQNTGSYLGYHDWRLPNAKELQSLVDYSRSPDTTGSAAIDPLFEATSIINEAGQPDFSYYWTSTTHANWTNNPGGFGAYVAFGRAMGFMNGHWLDVHGAGAQRSDPKAGDPAQYPTGHGPQGDAIRIYNDVRLVRDSGTGA